MILNNINNWFNRTKQYFFTYSDGFFNLSYLSNSPDLIVSSSKKLPFMKFDDGKQTLHTDNPFIRGVLFYMELEKGLWFMNGKMEYKNNVAYKPIYDTALPADYYCLTINVIQNKFKSNFSELNNYKIEDHSIIFLKPKKDFKNCHFKGSFENHYSVYFDKEWAKKNILNTSKLSASAKALFEDNEIGLESYKFDKEKYKTVLNGFQTAVETNEKPDLFILKLQTYNFFELFFSSLEELQTNDTRKFSTKERILFEKIEHYLINSIYEKFIGIEALSIKYKISTTKLKNDFKTIYGSSIFTFFQKKQMEVALDILQKKVMNINQVAALFKYENVSKFSKTFEKVNKAMPSKVIRTQ